jgi:hypothetical protein
MTPAVSLSLAGVAIAIVVMWANFRPWWKGNRDPKALIPYGSGWLLGALATVCVGGALGWGAAGITGLTSASGDTGIGAVIGTGAAQLATSRMGTLAPAGGVVTFLIMCGVILLYRASGKQDRRRIFGGILTGAVLAVLPGVAATLDWLPATVNALGAYGQSLLEGQATL